MRKILPILLAVAAYLTPLYPVYAENKVSVLTRPLKTATTTGFLKPQAVGKVIEKRMEKVDNRMENLKDKMASRSSELKEKLAKFKDKAKAIRVENINNNLNSINNRRTSQMQQVLAKISQILERIKNKTSEAQSSGKDVAAINSAIDKVEKEWAEADAAVKAQAEKDYSIVVNKESTAKSDASSARDSLRTDLKTVHGQVVEARQALANAISTALSSIKGNNNGSN